MSGGLPMPVRGATAWRTCRGCGELTRIELFARSQTVSGYGPRCVPCHRERKRKMEREMREWRARRAQLQATRVREFALDTGEEMQDRHRVRTNGDTRYLARLRRCLGPCGEMWLSPSCGHRFCPRCSRMVYRSTESVETVWTEFGEGNGNGG